MWKKEKSEKIKRIERLESDVTKLTVEKCSKDLMYNETKALKEELLDEIEASDSWEYQNMQAYVDPVKKYVKEVELDYLTHMDKTNKWMKKCEARLEEIESKLANVASIPQGDKSDSSGKRPLKRPTEHKDRAGSTRKHDNPLFTWPE
jgi:hypothetical protein